MQVFFQSLNLAAMYLKVVSSPFFPEKSNVFFCMINLCQKMTSYFTQRFVFNIIINTSGTNYFKSTHTYPHPDILATPLVVT